MAIPARNEREVIERCLVAVDAAARRVNRRVVIVVAADTCHDDTAATARRVGNLVRTPVVVVEGTWRTAARARAAAVDTAFEVLGSCDGARVWIANTDADCVVPPAWLQVHVDHAADDTHAVAGIVDLDPGTNPRVVASFRATYRLGGPTHTHVHGANFGVRADAYTHIGGWNRHAVVGEEHDLVRRLIAADLTVRHVTASSVITSSRTTGRVPAGFASRLAVLADPDRPRRRARLARTLAS